MTAPLRGRVPSLLISCVAALSAWSAPHSLRIAVAAPAAEPPVVRLAGGEATMPVVVSPKATPRARAAAAALADYLGRIASAKFEVVEGDGAEGIALGLAADFPAVKLGPGFAGEPGDVAQRERYLLRSHARGLYAVAVTDAGVEHAAWDLLYRLGYRQFFPGETWEVVPAAKELSLAVDADEKPDYLVRRIWYGFGSWNFNEAAQGAWRARNRANYAFELNTGHAYDGIIRKYKAVFDEHPEYYGLVKGERKSTKLCASNPGVRDLVVRYAREFFAANPDADSVSVDPSDGGGWCECDGCAKLGAPSDSALTLANAVSQVLEAEYPGKYVAMYAYNQHSPPPSIEARPRVIVNAATAFLKGGRTVEQVIDGWTAKGVRQFGVREYYGVNTWDRDLPGRSRGSDLAYLARTIPAFHARGARFMSAESSDSWGPNGLGFYLANRVMWDVGEARPERIAAIKADFFDRAFGPARGPMEKFYELLDGSRDPVLSSDLLGRMYRHLAEAGRLAGGDARVRARLDQLALYARYVELFRDYSAAEGAERQAAFERLIRHAYRTSRTVMVHTKALYRDLPGRDKSVAPPAGATWQKPEGSNPWKETAPWSRDEVDALVTGGVARNALAGFEPVEFGNDLVPAAGLGLPDAPPLNDTTATRGEITYYTWAPNAPAEIELQVAGGLIAHYRDRGHVRIRLYAGALEEGTERGGDEETPADAAEVPPDGETRAVKLNAPAPGLYRLWLNDGSDRTRVEWPAGLHRTTRAGAGDKETFAGRRSGYFYVPRGTKTVGGYAEGGGKIHDAEGKPAYEVGKKGEFFNVPVPPGQDGRLWSVRGLAGSVQLMTVPPYLARSPGELLLPKAVVEAVAPDPR